MMLVIDQFEELITLCHDEEEREAFLNMLSQAIQDHPKILRIVLTLRSDFEPQFSTSVLVKYWAPARFVVPPMSQDELREVIEGPASVRVLYFEPYELVEDLINEVVLTPGALPLLSFTLSELYVRYLESRRDNRALTRDDYEALGGVVGSLRNRATAEYEQLDEAHQHTMRRVMMRMVAVEGGELARRRAPRYELVYTDPQENERVESVLQQLVEARLLVEGQDQSGEAYVEPAHDALVRAWDRLLVWQRQAQEYLPLQRRVAQAAIDWDHTTDVQAKTRLLWNDNPRLPQVQEAVVMQVPLRKGMANLAQQARRALWPDLGEPKRTTWLNRLETEFVQQSVVRQAQVLRRVVMITLGVILALSTLTVIAFLARGAAVRSEADEAAARVDAENSASTAVFEAEVRATAQANEAAARVEAEEKAAVASSRALAAQSLIQLDKQLDLAVLLSLEAYDRSPTIEAMGSMLSGLVRSPYLQTYWRAHNDRVQSLAFSPDGSVLATGDCYGIILWDFATGRALGDPLTAADFPQLEQETGDSVCPESLAFSPDGRILAVGDFWGTILLWDVATGEPIGVPLGSRDQLDYPNSINSVAFNRNGNMLVSGAADGFLSFWDPATATPFAEPVRVSDYGIENVAFSPDGRFLVASDIRNSVQIWDTETGELLNELPDAGSILAFGPWGSLATAWGGGGEIVIWDITTGERKSSLAGHSENIFSLAFSPNGQTLASASNDHTIKLWNVYSGELLAAPLVGHSNSVNAVAFSLDGQTLVSGGDDHSVILWNLDGIPRLGQYMKGHSGIPRSVAFSPNGLLVASGGTDNAVIVWDIATGRQFHEPLLGHTATVTSVEFSPDSMLLASGDEEGKIYIWDVDTGEQVGQPLSAHLDIVYSVAFSPDGSTLASGSRDETIILWDVSTLRPLGDPLTGHTYYIFDLTFSPNGEMLVSSGNWAEIILWDVAARQMMGELDGDIVGSVQSVAFSPDGRTLAAASDDEKIVLWDMTTRQPVGQPFLGHTDDVIDVAFGPDGTLIASRSRDGTVVLWDVARGEPIGLPIMRTLYRSGQTGFGNSVAFSPDGTKLATDAWEGVFLWDLSIDVWKELACKLVNRNLSEDEWDHFIGSDTPYHRACPDLPPG
jgi:WD40 repeat protein